MDPATQAQLTILRRQYFQLVEPTHLRWPDDKILKTFPVQSWIFDNLFDRDKIPSAPPDRYRLRILKILVSNLERAIEDPDEDEILDDLMTALSSLVSTTLPSETTAAQQKASVTYAYPVHPSDDSESGNFTVAILESRNILSSSGTTGLRTWEASLLLGSYLVTSETGRRMIEGKRVFELGAGAGMLSILCAKYLAVSGIVASDGDEVIVDMIKDNIFLNGLDTESVSHSVLRTASLKWGRSIDAVTFSEDYGMEIPDVVLGADVTYDRYAIPSLVSTLREFFQLNPALQVLIAATIRNEKTFETLQNACRRNGFSLELVEFPLVPEHLQEGPFYSITPPIQIWRITQPRQSYRDPFAL
ncbi:putative methyltransferase-domain-containing protein [Clohesyomyces aquaticus]|uniref:Putative methyltransferase-domain-containing protein n=1 Tax=Clohesyomyces aquaticus TaxID=1231657 RepID=A0A1Y1YEH4_9PLEO|nr:putative methyltransferase-domain-containing protein [Clohesyomyces aquaticus]